jgi:hypothetical protein
VSSMIALGCLTVAEPVIADVHAVVRGSFGAQAVPYRTGHGGVRIVVQTAPSYPVSRKCFVCILRASWSVLSPGLRAT